MSRGRASELGVALTVGGLGTFLFVHASGIPFGAGYDRIGPRVFPYLVAVGLLGLAAFLAAAALRGRAAFTAPAWEGTLNLRPLAWLAVALALVPLAMDRTGFVPAAAAQFWLAARAFHSRRPWRDAIAAVVVAFVVYMAFARGLGMTLPQGPLEALL